MQGPGQLAHEADVLELQFSPSAGSEVAPNHAVAMEFEDAALRESSQQRFADPGGVHACEFRQSQGLGDGVNGLGHDQLVGQLRHLSGTRRAHVGDPGSNGAQDGQGALKRFIGPSGHDGQSACLGADLSAGDGCIQPGRSPRKFPGLRHAGGAEIDDQRAWIEAFADAAGAEDDSFDHVGGCEVDANDAGADRVRQFGEGVGAFHAEGGCGCGWTFTAIPYDHVGACGVETSCHRPAHVAQADESNLVSGQRRVHVHAVIPNETWSHGKSSSPAPMKVVITGGGGFLGSQLCQQLLRRGAITGPSGALEPIREIVLFDAFVPRPSDDPRVKHRQGDVSDRATVCSVVGTEAATAIFHLASMVSGECEDRFDDALRVNLEGGRNVFEAARALPGVPRLIFASSIACFGGEARQDPNTDRTKLTPETTYGMTKAVCELLVNDYSRKGFFDGRSARLPTVIIRPGKPNAAASGWASGMFREPLNGEPCHLPVRRDQCHPMTGYRTVVESLIALHEVPPGRLSDDRAIGLPAHRVTPRLAETVLREIAEERGLRLGPITDGFNARIQGIVDHWPVAVDGTRAVALGLPQPPTLKAIVEQYLEDFGGQ